MDESSAKAAQERRNRVVFNLPLNNQREARAVRDIVAYLWEGRQKKHGIGGFTTSDSSMPVFQGWWWSDDRKMWVGDKLVMFMLDFLDPSFDNSFLLIEEVSKLKQFIQERYSFHGATQDEIWIVTHPINRVE